MVTGPFCEVSEKLPSRSSRPRPWSVGRVDADADCAPTPLADKNVPSRAAQTIERVVGFTAVLSSVGPKDGLHALADRQALRCNLDFEPFTFEVELLAADL